MSYTRRTGNFGKPNIPLSSVGQRRPMPNTFNKITENKQQLHQQPHQQHQQNQPQQPFQSKMQQQEKPKAVPPPQAVQNQQAANQQSKPPPVQETQQSPPPGAQKPQQGSTSLQQVAEQMVAEHTFKDEKQPVVVPPEMPGISNYGIGDCNDIIIPKNKPFWMKRNGRVNKAERARRRNVRLRKLLQPKNALMIINELVGAVAFDLSETKSGYEDVYKAAVVVDGTEYVGFGKSKAIAKTSAAESAVRAMILKKLKITTAQINPAAEEENKDVKMELVTEENQDDVSWTHIASFAIHKLFSSWGDDGNMADMISRASSVGSLHDGSIKDDSISGIQTQPEQKPAKRLPENAALMNPIMLLNQMHPSAKYEELGKSGIPPHIQFTIRCLVGTHAFVGIGQNKKAARKQAAFEACRTLLDIQYPPEVIQGMLANKPIPMETS